MSGRVGIGGRHLEVRRYGTSNTALISLGNVDDMTAVQTAAASHLKSKNWDFMVPKPAKAEISFAEISHCVPQSLSCLPPDNALVVTGAKI